MLQHMAVHRVLPQAGNAVIRRGPQGHGRAAGVIEGCRGSRKAVVGDLHHVAAQRFRAAQQIFAAQAVNIPQKEDALPLHGDAQHGGMVVEGALSRQAFVGKEEIQGQLPQPQAVPGVRDDHGHLRAGGRQKLIELFHRRQVVALDIPAIGDRRQRQRLKVENQPLQLDVLAVVQHHVQKYADVVLMGMGKEPSRNARLSFGAGQQPLIQPLILARGKIAAVHQKKAAVGQGKGVAHAAVHQGVIQPELGQRRHTPSPSSR